MAITRKPVSIHDHTPVEKGTWPWKRYECRSCGMPFRNVSKAIEHQAKMRFINAQGTTAARMAQGSATRAKAEAIKKAAEMVEAEKAREEKLAEDAAWMRAELEEALQAARDEGHAEGKWEAVEMVQRLEEQVLDENTKLLSQYGMNSTGAPRPGSLQPPPEKLAELRGAAMVLSKLASDLRGQGWT